MAENQKIPKDTREDTLSSPLSPLDNENSSEEKNVDIDGDKELSHSPALEGWRLRLLTIGLCLCVFLSALDITIVSTSLTSISNDLHAFNESSWVVSSYLTSYFSMTPSNPT
ncbi:hypothetical protein AFGD_008745 [Aspergillus flavus]|nr:hypothetical protein AFGD_008745 [Aspergillus flavus]